MQRLPNSNLNPKFEFLMSSMKLISIYSVFTVRFHFSFLNFEQLCTLEFETRRASYYWLLHALGIYQPYVWEYSRLNITNTVMSKRKVSNISLESLKFELYLLFCDKSNYWYACCFS